MTAELSLADLARRPVLPRLLVVAACAALSVLQRGTAAALLPALVLAAVAGAASARRPHLPRWVRLTVEGVVSAVLVGGLATDGSAYTAYTLVPVTIAGVAGRARRALVTSASTALAYVVAAGTSAAVGDPSGDLSRAVLHAGGWAVTLFAFTLLAVTVRRVRVAPGSEPLYRDAHRLLSELEGVSRQLSLGLDPRTLAEALREDVCVVSGARDACVLVHTPGGRFTALAGQEPADVDDARLHAAWAGRDDRAGPGDGPGTLCVPVLMDGEPVALVVLTGAPEEGGLRDRVRRAAARSGPRLSSALLFDEVRRLATVDERNRLAREIHDGVAQDLASLAYLVDDAGAGADPATAARLDEVAGRVRGLVGELRLRLFDLRTGVTDAVGLGGAVGEYLQQVGAQTGLAVRLTLDEGTRRLPTSVEVEILRVLQEAVTNVRRHSRAGRVSVELSVHPPKASLRVEDDGRGLQGARPDSLGITGMRERAARIGARLSVGDAPGGGTRVELVLSGAPDRVPHPEAARIGHDGEDDRTAGADEEVPGGRATPREEETTA